MILSIVTASCDWDGPEKVDFSDPPVDQQERLRSFIKEHLGVENVEFAWYLSCYYG